MLSYRYCGIDAQNTNQTAERWWQLQHKSMIIVNHVPRFPNDYAQEVILNLNRKLNKSFNLYLSTRSHLAYWLEAGRGNIYVYESLGSHNY